MLYLVFGVAVVLVIIARSCKLANVERILSVAHQALQRLIGVVDIPETVKIILTESGIPVLLGLRLDHNILLVGLLALVREPVDGDLFPQLALRRRHYQIVFHGFFRLNFCLFDGAA